MSCLILNRAFFDAGHGGGSRKPGAKRMSAKPPRISANHLECGFDDHGNGVSRQLRIFRPAEPIHFPKERTIRYARTFNPAKNRTHGTSDFVLSVRNADLSSF